MVPMFPREQMDSVVAAIREADRILLTCHINPDGDALGSMIALGLALRHLEKTVVMVSADGIPEILRFLPSSEDVVTDASEATFDLAIVLDAGELARVGRTRPAVDATPRVIDIDHHVTAGVFGDIRLLDATAAATAEIVYDLLHALGVDITLHIAECLLCGLLTDTGSFRFMNVTPRTMAIGGELIGIGASPNRIAEFVFENKSFAAQKLLGRALDSLQQSADGRVVWAGLRKEDFADFDATDEVTEGIVASVRAVRGNDVAALFREMPNGKIRVSLRGRPPADVSLIAAHFGGGGHRLASGCTLDGPLADAEARLVAEIHRRLAETSESDAVSASHA
jgi:phosphoesterase RecJ-like protein